MHTRWPIGPVCSPCYIVVLDAPAACTGCGRHQPLIGTAEDGTGICGACSGTAFDYTCRTCGLGGRTYADAQCARCVLTVRLQQLLAGPAGHIPEQLQPLRDTLALAERPRGILHWLKHSPNAALFASLAASGEPITHQRLDQLPPSRHLHYVRHTLVHLGALPARDEELDRIPAWLDTVLADRPAGHIRLVHPYAHWHLLRRARRRAAQRRRPAEPGSFLRTRVLVALEFLTWLDEHGLDLGGLLQDHLDRWLDAGNTRIYAIRDFLFWTTGRGLTANLTVPSIPRQQPSRLMSEDSRWQLLKRCLTDSTMALDTRAAGALILLFGLHASQVRHLTATQLTHRDGNSYLTVDRHPILLPPVSPDSSTNWPKHPTPGPPLPAPTAASRGSFPASSPAARPLSPASARNSWHAASTPGQPETRLWSHSPATCPHQSSRASSASTSTPQFAGRGSPRRLGPTTSPPAPTTCRGI
ncbi:hypothetical protein ACWCPO_21375 [Streptomyces albidoflavus]